MRGMGLRLCAILALTAAEPPIVDEATTVDDAGTAIELRVAAIGRLRFHRALPKLARLFA